MIEIVDDNLPGFTGEAKLVKRKVSGKDRYFVVSGTSAAFTGWEVLVFPADETGKVTDWGEVCGGRGISMQSAIDILDAMTDDEFDNPDVSDD